jgi:DNA-directed RNA polymerase subunit H (RpoH/RPB5)
MQPPVFVIYKNLPEFIEARILKSTHQFGSDEKSLDALVSNMEKVGYIDLKFGNDAGTFVEIIIIYANSEYSRKTPKLKQLIANIESTEDFIAGKIVELIFIVDNDFIKEKRLVAVIDEKRNLNKPYPYVRLCPYSMFVVNMTKKPEVPKSRIMTNEEISSHIKFNRKTVKDIQTISEKNDPIITWLGARKGDFIESELLSRNAGITYSIRRVI